MLVFNCTKAAGEFFSVTRKGQKLTPVIAPPTKEFSQDSEHILDEQGNRPELMQWLVHAIKVQGKHVLVAMEMNSRYSMIFAALKKGDVNTFITLFHERLLNNMLWYGESIDEMDQESFLEMSSKWMAMHPDYRFFNRGDRSVQTHINDVLWHFKSQAAEVGHLPDNQMEAASFDEFSNQLWRQTKCSEKNYPYQRLFSYWLERVCDTPKADIDNMLEELGQRNRFTIQDLLLDDAFDELDEEEIDDFEEFEAEFAKLAKERMSQFNLPFDEERPIPDNVVPLFAKNKS